MRYIIIAMICLSVPAGAWAYEIVGADIEILNRIAKDPRWFDGSVGFSAKDIKGFRAEAAAELKRQQEALEAGRQSVTPKAVAPVRQGAQQESAPQATTEKPKSSPPEETDEKNSAAKKEKPAKEDKK